MSVRMRHTRAHTGNRRSHHAIKESQLSVCAKCGATHIRHRACLSCGTYRDRQVLNVMKDVEKKIKKAEQRSKTEKAEKKETKKAEEAS